VFKHQLQGQKFVISDRWTICNCVENLVKKKYGIDQKQFVVEIVNDIFNGLNQIEIENISNMCQF
jgi:hypothetical protein